MFKIWIKRSDTAGGRYIHGNRVDSRIKLSSLALTAIMERKNVIGMTLLLLAIVAVSAVVIMPETACCALELDGKIDNDYYWYGEAAYHANADYSQADGFLFVIDNTSIDPDYIWAVWILNASYVDNTYGDNAIGYPGGHNLDQDLLESDGQRIAFYDNCSNLIFHAFFDLLAGDPELKDFFLSGWYEDEQNPLTYPYDESYVYDIDTGDNQTYFEYNTSTLRNLLLYKDVTTDYDVMVNSPTPYGNYTPHANYSEWEVRHVYEIRINRSVFSAGCTLNVTATEFPSIHASPNKIDQKTPPLVLTSCLGDFVWEDTNNNGIQEADEPVIRDATVSLYYGNNDTFISNTTTDWWGFYKFTNLTPGNYYVKFYNPNTSYYIGFSPQNQSTNDNRDSDANTTTGQTAVTTLEADETDLTWDCGLPPVPELSTLALFSVGLLTLAGYVGYSRRRTTKK